MIDIKVNEKDWTGLSDADREKIRDIISNAFREPHKLVPDGKVSGAHQLRAAAPDLTAAAANPVCTAACSAAESIAVAACGALSPPLNAICIAAAHAAGEFCRGRCK